MFYHCQKDNQEVKTIVLVCNKCELSYHPSCVKYHKTRNAKGELVECTAGYKAIDRRNKKEMLQQQNKMDNDMQIDETHLEYNDDCDKTKAVNENSRKRMRLEDINSDDSDFSDEEILRRVIQNTIRAEVCPLIEKIDVLQREVIDSKKEIVELKRIISNLTNEKTNLQVNNNNNNVQAECGSVADRSYASVAQKKKVDAVIVAKPVNTDVAAQSNVNKDNKNENLNCVKNNINVKELGVGVTSVKEKKNGTVILKFKNVKDKEKLQKNVVDKIGQQFKIQIPKTQKKFVKIVYIDNEDSTLTNEQLVNDIIQQNNLRECCEKIEMKIVKRIVNDKKDDFSIIVEVNPEVQKFLLYLDRVSLGWKQCKVIEHINIIQCFKCCGFNHYADKCKRDVTCGKCGGAHSSKNCNVTEVKCTNCAHLNLNKKKKNKDSSNDDKHNAFDKKCPIYINLVESHKKRDEENK